MDKTMAEWVSVDEEPRKVPRTNWARMDWMDRTITVGTGAMAAIAFLAVAGVMEFKAFVLIYAAYATLVLYSRLRLRPEDRYLKENLKAKRLVWKYMAEVVAAQGTETGAAETEGLGPKDDGPVAEGAASNSDGTPSIKNTGDK